MSDQCVMPKRTGASALVARKIKKYRIHDTLLGKTFKIRGKLLK